MSRLREMIITEIRGIISAVNSSNIPLGISGVFTGTLEEITDIGIIYVNVFSDVGSATDGLSIQQSSDGTNWNHTDEFTIPSGSGKNFSINAVAKYFRIVYTNGGTIQGEFRLQTIFKSVYGKPSSHRIQDSIISDDDAELVKAVGTGIDDSGVFRNIGVTSDGAQKISDESSGLAIAEGDVTGKSFVHKFGNAPDFDTADNEVTIWDGAEDGTAWELMNYIYSSTDDIDSVSSTDAGDTATVTIEGLDVNWNFVSQQAILTGQVRVALSTPLLRIFRAFNDNGTEYVGHIIIYVNGATTGGVPDNSANIRAVIHPEDQQTLMAIYTIPAGKTGYMRDWYIATSGGSKSSNYVFKVKVREDGGVFRTKHKSALEALSPIPYQHDYTEPEVFQEKTDIEMKVQSIASPAAVENAVSAGFDIVLVDN